MIITFEGTDQAGKKTQTDMLARKLRKARLPTKTFSFPVYGTPVGKVLQKMLTSHSTIQPQVIHSLMSANRWEVLPKLNSAIESSSVLILNRYYQSNIAYGVANGLGRAWLESLDTGLPRSDLVILLDSHHAESLRRKSKNRDRFERNVAFLAKVAKVYRQMAKRNKWGVVDATQDRKTVHEAIMKIISRRLRV